MNLYEKPAGWETRWASFENLTAGRGIGGQENKGAKGHAFDRLAPGETVTLLDVAGGGMVTRIWMTINDRSPERLRSLRLDIFWDGAETPAVSVPLGDFFGIGLGRRTPFECALFSDPEGRSFNCFIPMPFRQSARITLTNEAETTLTHLFYDINLLTGVTHSDEMCYFHAHWRREQPNVLGEDFILLPKVTGKGRFLGCNIGVIADQIYEDCWWGEGEVKVWFGDDTDPTLCGTGTEDYIGTAWGQGAYAQRTAGCPIADSERKQWAFYRYHIDDPIYFEDACRVAIQTIGGSFKDQVLAMYSAGVPLIPISIDPGETGTFIKLMDLPQPVDYAAQPAGWYNFYRQDDWSATVYFYLNNPAGVLPPLAPVSERIKGLSPVPAEPRADI